MNTLSKLAAVCAALVSITLCPSTARSQTIGVHVVSMHMPARPDQNNQNLGLYVRSADGWTLGGYRNTLRRTSLYAGGTMSLLGPLDLTAGVISGYQDKGGKGHSRGALSPLLAFSYALPVAVLGVTPRVTYVPGHLVKASDVLHLSFEF